MVDATWYYARNKQKVGPVAFSVLRQLAASGRLRPTDMVLQAGCLKWVQAGSIRGLYPVAIAIALPKPGETTSTKRNHRTFSLVGNSLGWLCREIWETAIATWNQAKRLFCYGKALWRQRNLDRGAAKAELVLGERLYKAGLGDRELHSRLTALDQQIGLLVQAKKSTRPLRSRRMHLVRQLAKAAPTWQDGEAIKAERAKTDETIKASRQQQEVVRKVRSKLPPQSGSELRRVGVGYAMMVGLIVGLMVWAGAGWTETSPAFYDGKPLSDWIALLKGQDEKERAKAIEALVRMGKPAVPALVDALTDQSSAVRFQAASILGQIGPNAKSAVRALKEATKDTDLLTRRTAAIALVRVRPEEIKTTTATLLDLMKVETSPWGGEKGFNSSFASDDLASLGRAAIPYLIEALSDLNPTLRRNVAATLGKMGPGAKGAVGALVKALEDREAVVRVAAAASLARLSPDHSEQAVDVLVAAVKDREDSPSAVRGRYAAIAALGELGPLAKPAVPALSSLVQGFGDPLERAAKDALEKIMAEAEGGTGKGPDREEAVRPRSNRFPISAAQAKQELGPPTDSDDNFLYYRDQLRVDGFEAPNMGLMVERAGIALAVRLFRSKLFTAEEGKELVALLIAKEGKRKIGRFEVTAKESIVVDGVVIMTITMAQ